MLYFPLENAHKRGFFEILSPQSIFLVPNSPRMKSGNRINNRLVFKIRGGYKLVLQTPETMKLFGRTKKKKDKTENGEKVSKFSST